VKPVPISGEICILAGGLSSRMGRDKARLSWRGKSLLQHVKVAAQQSPWPVRVIRRDLVARCGPLGGIYTALKTTTFDVVLFLACDMPFVTGDLMGRFLELKDPAFTQGPEGAGFPFLLPKSVLSLVEKQIASQRYSIQLLAKKFRAQKVRPRDAQELFNVNTPEDWALARKIQREPKRLLLFPPKIVRLSDAEKVLVRGFPCSRCRGSRRDSGTQGQSFGDRKDSR
jgi:molybdopterin-guanine dinucleotide biosynthesis protein A